MTSTPTSRDDTAHGERQGSAGSPYGAVAGLLAVGVMFGVAELVAGMLSDGRSLVVAVGDIAIDIVPGPVERAVISTLGTWDKPFLIASILVASALLGAALGTLAARRFLLGAAGLAAMAAVGVAASLMTTVGFPTSRRARVDAAASSLMSS